MKELQYFLISVHLVCFSALSYRCLFVSATLITRSAPKDKLFAAHEKLMRNPESCPVVVLVFIVFQSVHKLARSRRPFLHSVLMQIFYAKYTLLLHFLFNLIPHMYKSFLKSFFFCGKWNLYIYTGFVGFFSYNVVVYFYFFLQKVTILS